MKNILVSFVVFCGCVSIPKTEVVERIGNVSDTPEWSFGAITQVEENGRIIFISTVSMPATNRVESCTKAAGELGRSSIIRAVKDHYSSSGQTEEKTEVLTESLHAYIAQGTLSDVRDDSRYWEKRLEFDPHGNKSLKIHCAAKVSISKVKFEQLMAGKVGSDSVRKAQEDKTRDFILNAEPAK